MTQAIAFPDDLPATTFRCGSCGAIVGRFDPTAAGGFRLPLDAPFRCRVHGELVRPDMRAWYAEWTRRGKSGRLNVKLSAI